MNAHFHLLFLFLILQSLSVFGQNPEANSDFLPISNYRYQTVFQNVFLPLCKAANIAPVNIHFHILKIGEEDGFGNKGAWYIYNDKQKTHNITIEQKLYDSLCRPYATDSLATLAFFIGHELGHYRQIKSGGAACTAFHLDALLDEKQAQEESNADIQGLLLARIAGFKTIKIQDLMGHFYQKFGIIDNPNYPTKAERIGFFKQDSVKSEQGYALFNGALHLLCANQPDHAVTVLEHLYTTEKLTAPEVANNLITAYLQRMQTSLHEETQFNYSIPLALNSKLRSRTSGEQDGQTKRRILLNRLDTILQRALTQMPNDSTLAINRALHTILHEWNEGKITEAQALIAAFNANSNLARYGTIDAIGTKEVEENECQNDEKTFDRASLVSLSANIHLQQTEKEWLIGIKNNTETIHIKGTDGKSATNTTACGIRIGSTVKDLENAYGKGFFRKTSQHDLYLYKNGLLCFYVQNGVVVNWSLVRL